ncbi:MAG: FadR family transcriptional regulator [Firmicutes bacterium]|nr:FadR family transcriptional regulator [Bacillota bacterium]
MKAIKRNKIGELVYKQMYEQIVKGEWAPGTKIPSENELAKRLGVSRITVREALQRLISLGLLEAHHGEGTYVKQVTTGTYMNSLISMLVLDPVDLIEVMEYRKIVEIETAGLAVERATVDDLEKLEKIFRRMEQYKNDVEQFAVEDLDFHLALAEAAKNPLIIKVNTIVKDILSVSMARIVHSLGTANGLYYHQKILEALKNRDKEAAKKIMSEHLTGTIMELTNANK